MIQVLNILENTNFSEQTRQRFGRNRCVFAMMNHRHGGHGHSRPHSDGNKVLVQLATNTDRNSAKHGLELSSTPMQNYHEKAIENPQIRIPHTLPPLRRTSSPPKNVTCDLLGTTFLPRRVVPAASRCARTSSRHKNRQWSDY